MRLMLIATATTLLLDKVTPLTSPSWLHGAATALSKGQVRLYFNSIHASFDYILATFHHGREAGMQFKSLFCRLLWHVWLPRL